MKSHENTGEGIGNCDDRKRQLKIEEKFLEELAFELWLEGQIYLTGQREERAKKERE